MVPLEDMTMAAFAACNGLRLFAYLPQMLKAARDRNGASAISFTTWGLFLTANLSTAAYAIVNQSDWWMAGCFVLNAVCCLLILIIAAVKAVRHAKLCAYRNRYKTPGGDADAVEATRG
jgi:uncharacterized protein with PQ loop repeat